MKWLVVALLLFTPVAASAASTLEDVTFYSESLGFDRGARVYLPDGYDVDSRKGYPVVYFLHGSTYGYSNYWVWWSFQEILDTLIGTGEIPPVIFVTVDGLIGPYSGGYWTNSDLYGNFEDLVSIDLVEYMDENYNTIPKRKGRAIHGLSMGGYGAMKIGLKNSKVFGAIASHSGPIELDASVEATREAVLMGYPEYPDGPYDYRPDAGYFSGLIFTRAGAYSPNLDNPPFFVDFPLDEWGEIDASVMDTWRLNCAAYLASQVEEDDRGELRIFFDCGTEDQVFAYEAALAFRDRMDELGIPYEFQDFLGNHSNRFGERFPIGLTWVVNALARDENNDDGRPIAAPHEDAMLSAGSHSTGMTIDGTRIEYTVERPCQVDLTIFDSSGRAVRQLLSKHVSAGVHSFVWDSRDDVGQPVASGIYFTRLNADRDFVASEKIVVVR